MQSPGEHLECHPTHEHDTSLRPTTRPLSTKDKGGITNPSIEEQAVLLSIIPRTLGKLGNDPCNLFTVKDGLRGPG
jgi:hypothetical protein